MTDTDVPTTGGSATDDATADDATAEQGVEHEAAAPGHDGHMTSTGISNPKLAMWVFLGSECLLFGGMISTFLLYKDNDTAGGPLPRDLYDIEFTSISSFVLLMSSLTMVLAVSAIGRGDHTRLRLWLAATAVLGSIFIAGQAYEFQVFVEEGMGFTTNSAASAFFALTGLHGVHVSLGIIMLLSTLLLSVAGKIPTARAEAVEIVGLYWHFVDVVWVLIFTVVYLIE